MSGWGVVKIKTTQVVCKEYILLLFERQTGKSDGMQPFGFLSRMDKMDQ